jgi:hypothetical protein
MTKTFIAVICLLLASCASAPKPAPTTTPPNLMDPAAWNIGPVINGYDYSVNAPAHPSVDTGGWSFNIPSPTVKAGQVCYVTTNFGSLAGKKTITLKFNIVADPSVSIYPINYPTNNVSELALYFQEKGDNWSAAGNYETYRWYSSFRMITPLKAGSYTLTANLNENWTAILTSSAQNNPTAFQAAIKNASAVGFVLGGGTGIGHGVFATGPAKLVVTDFEVQ